MNTKYSFAAAFIVITSVLVALNLAGWAETDVSLTIALGSLGLISAAAAWFTDLLDWRLSRVTQTLERIAENPSRMEATVMDTSLRNSMAPECVELTNAINHCLTELRASAAHSRAISEHGPDAMWVFNVEKFVLVDVNENFVKLTGYSRDKLVGMTPMDVSPPEQAGGRKTEEYAQWLIARMLTGEKVSEPWIIRPKNGPDIPCELRAIHLPMPGATLVCGSLMDMSERIRANAELDHRRGFEKLLTRLSSSLLSLTSEHMDSGVRHALREVGEFAGVDRSYVFLFNETRMRVRCSHEWCAEGIEAQIGRLQNLRVSDYPWVEPILLDGHVVHVPKVSDLPAEAAAEKAEWLSESIQSILLVPMRFQNDILGYVGFDSVMVEKTWPPEIIALLNIFGDMLINVLERSRSENRLRESSRILEMANAELERSNTELKQFAYIASHDLQEPLRAVSGFSALLAKRYKGQLDKDADEYIHYMMDAASRMQRMITDLLDYSRIDSRSKPFETCELEQLMRLALANLQASITELNAQVTFDPLPSVMGDPSLLVQLLQNLIGNAIKFHGKEVPTIHLAVKSEDRHWHFVLSDNGIGISAEDAELVFQIFRRLHSSEKYPGTGIGLAACKRIVERHYGRIWAEPRPGGGTLFHFTLPALDTAHSR